ncbi:MAG: hypothetical protein JEY96_19540 [Bacteroidales bacterium]|nr:hypothetical protein [Bacteroidales bacterium]
METRTTGMFKSLGIIIREQPIENFIMEETKFSRSQVKKAGELLKRMSELSLDELFFSTDALTYWRTLHSNLITDFHNDIKKVVEEFNSGVLMVQRIKRSQSIIAKLGRESNMKLNTMQDIAGMRIVVDDISEIYNLAKRLKDSGFKHKFINEKDYIENPKDSGYRGIHLIYKYTSEDKPELNNLYVEVQLRTRLQHTWATAVETMSTFLGTHLKFNEGQQKWLKYFALTSSAFSFFESTPAIPKYNNLSELETLKLALYEYNYYHISESLSAYSVAVNIICTRIDPKKKFHIVTLDIEQKKVSIQSFSEEQIGEANMKYTELEKNSNEKTNTQSVFVSTDNIQELKDGFPNYFLDIEGFLTQMIEIRERLNELKHNENNNNN